MKPETQALADFITERLYDTSDLHIKKWSGGRYGEYELVSQEELAPYIDKILEEYEAKISS